MRAAPADATAGRARWEVSVAPALLEEAVLLAAASRPRELAEAFQREREAGYSIAEPDRREHAFQASAARWAMHWGLTAPLLEALEALSHRPPKPRCLVLAAPSRRDEAADLHAAPGGPALVLRVRAATLADPGRLRDVLARELVYVDDLLDPDFGFDPARAGALLRRPAERERYRLLWRTTVDGRSGVRGAALAGRRAEFAAVLGPAVGDAGALFDRLLAGPRPSHAELAALAAGPAPSR